MSYLQDAREALRKIDDLCSKALMEGDDYKSILTQKMRSTTLSI